MPESACVAVGHFGYADVEILALLVGAALPVVAEAQRLAAVRQRQVFHGCAELCSFSVVLQMVCLCLPCFAFPVALFPLEPLLITMAGFGRGWSNACTSLRILVSSCNASNKVQPSPCSVAISFHNRLSACRSSVVVTVRRPESCGTLRCQVVDLFVEGSEDPEVRSSAHSDCIAEHALCLREPCGAKVPSIYGLVGCLIEESCAN